MDGVHDPFPNVFVCIVCIVVVKGDRMNGLDKVVYLDGDKYRVLYGKLAEEDEHFVTLILDIGKYKIGKRSIISIREGEHNE